MQRRQQKQHNSIVSVLIMLILFGGALSGCSDSEKAPGTPVPVVPKPNQKISSQVTATLAEAAPQPEFSYNPHGKRDPFAPIIMKEEQKARGGDRPPLERYDLQEFNLTGVVWGGFGYNAMLEGPDGKGYFVRVGTIIGPSRGVIKKITQHSLVIEEKFKTFSGETERKEIIMELRKKQEGMQ